MIGVADALHKAARLLAEAGIEAPRREARLLAAHLLGVEPGGLIDPEALLGLEAWDRLVARRARREPLAFITGRQGFWTLDLDVSTETLIPRADSEALIEAAVALFPDRDAVRRVLDLGTGTGCLLLAALGEFGSASGVGVDLSPGAAALARRNAEKVGMSGRAVFAVGHWADCLETRFDLVVCNPPYIVSSDIGGLMPEVARYEPARALDGGPDGLDAYRAVVSCLPRLLSPSGAAILELGEGQEGSVAGLAARACLDHVLTRPDLAGIPRALCLRRQSLRGQL